MATKRINHGQPAAQEVSGPETADGTEVPASERGQLPKDGVIVFKIDDRRLGFTQHKLSYIAGYTSSKAIRDADGPGRMPVKELLPLILEATGLPDEQALYVNEWEFTLPQTGRVVKAELIADRVKPEPEPEPVKATPRQSRSRAKAS